MPLSSVVGAQSIVRPGVCTSSTRPASPYDGQVIYETDTDKTLVWNGTGWVFLSTSRANPNGLDFISSTTASAVSSISINDCFSSTYMAYEIQIITTDNVGANSALTARLRVSGTDATTQYNTSRIYAYNSTTGAGADARGNDEWYIDDLDPTNKGYFAKMTLYNPNVAAKSTGRVSSNIIDSGGTFVLNEIALVHNAVTQFTGITFITSGTSFTGTIRVYGYVNS